MVAGAYAHTAHRFSRNIADAGTNIADNDIARAHCSECIVDKRYAVSGSSLTCNIHTSAVIRNAEDGFQRNNTAHIENDCPCAFERFKSVAQRALAAVVEIGDMIDIAAPAASCKTSVALGSRESKAAEHERVYRAFDCTVCAYLVHSPVVCRDRRIAVIDGIFCCGLIALEFGGIVIRIENGIITCTDVNIMGQSVLSCRPRKSL